MQSPLEQRDQDDVGDAVLRKFNYQHAYGVVLLIKMLQPNSGIKSIWCEQHEDLLEEFEDGTINAYQVKTKKTESGEWQLNDALFQKSINRFIDCDLKFPNRISSYYFVSNTSFSKSKSASKGHLSPVNLLKAINLEKTYTKLIGLDKKGFEYLAKELDVDQPVLFAKLKKVELVYSLTERAFEDELCQRHISSLDRFSTSSAKELKKASACLMSLVSNAASLSTDDPSRDWIGLTKNLQEDPYLAAKSIELPDIELSIRDVFDQDVRFPEGLASLSLQGVSRKMNVLNKKLERGGLSARFDVMYRRAVLAESELLDLASRSESEKEKISHLENVVLGECDDSFLRMTQTGGDIFGANMLIDVQDKLKDMANGDSNKIYGYPYEFLVGVAGLLTSECKVWWSEKFNLEEDE